MIVKKQGGMTEFIPSPQEKRDGLIRDHILALLKNIHRRLTALEQKSGLLLEEGEVFETLCDQIEIAEFANIQLNIELYNADNE